MDILVDETPKEGKMTLGKAVHVALVVTEQETVQMTCHYCDKGRNVVRDKKKKKTMKKKSKDMAKISMLWYKISRKTEGKHKEVFKVKEVDLDMHDMDRKNRVFVTDTHTLVIRKVTHKDGGSYFCRDMTKLDPFFKKKLTPAEIAAMFEADDMLRFMYHVDVLTVKDEKRKTIMVTTNTELNTSLPLATPDVKVEDYNMEIFTSWEEWSRCSSCDQPGTRRRLGVCMVRKIDREKKSKPWYVNMMLSIYQRGILCRSTAFNKQNQLHLKVLRPVDEIEEAVCTVSCTNYTMSITDMVFTDPGKVKIQVFVLKEGESVALECPNAPADMPVAWVNGTRVLIRPYLRAQSDDRLSIDYNNTFHISRLEVTDSGHYLCIFGGKIGGRVMLGVEPTPPSAVVWRYAYYLVCTYPIDFVIFLCLLYVRHAQRQRVLNYDMLPEVDDEDSTASGSSASDINVNREASDGRFVVPSSVTTLVETPQRAPNAKFISARSSSIIG